MKETTKLINEALTKVYANGKIEEAVSEILGDPGIKAGARVAIISDRTYGMEGIQGKVKGPTDNMSGCVDVELENGVVLPLFANLLVAL